MLPHKRKEIIIIITIIIIMCSSSSSSSSNVSHNAPLSLAFKTIISAAVFIKTKIPVFKTATQVEPLGDDPRITLYARDQWKSSCMQAGRRSDLQCILCLIVWGNYENVFSPLKSTLRKTLAAASNVFHKKFIVKKK